MREGASRQALWVVGLALAVLAWIALYALPRMEQIRRMDAENQVFDRDRGRVAEALASYAGLRRELPEPTPNLTAWLSQNALAGLENHLDFNNPYREGKGAHLKLRALNAEQVARLLEQMRRVNVIVKTLNLQDRDGDGRWDLESFVEVPKE